MQDRSTHKINWLDCPEPLKVNANDEYYLVTTFNNGVVKKFDFTPYFKYEYFAPLKDKKLFKQAKTIPSAIIWNDDLDIAIEEVYDKGVTIDNDN